jgi:hypothetical protein
MRYDYGYSTDESDSLYDVFEIATGRVVDHADSEAEAIAKIEKLEKHS